MSDLHVTDLQAGYDGHLVLHDVDLHVRSGEVVAVLGESGSGKSTLLRVIAGLVTPKDGRIEIDGRDVTDLPTHQRGVGMVFQHLALFPHATVAQNIAFAPRLAGRGRKERDHETTRWLDRVGLAGLGDRDVSTLSGGQRQRVALVRALAAEPAVLLLDEPLGAIDAGLRGELLALLNELFGQEGTTAILVTHDPAEAAALADRITVLDQGRVVQGGTSRELWLEPTSATVARLMGHPNVLLRPDGDFDLVPPDAARLDQAGPLTGTVTQLVAGAGWHAVVSLDDGRRLVVPVDPAQAPAVGDQVRVAVEDERLRRLQP